MKESIISLLNQRKVTNYMLNILLFIKRRFTVKKVNKSLITNIEGIEEYNIPIERFYEKKPKGISGVARLKNGDYFLELCLESHIPFLDELILVDNQSTDKTKEICKKLEKKYPNKIKFYEYPYSVNPPSDKNKDIPVNSIHSLAYYYNWCFSKTKYDHVMKVDDDNLLITEKRGKIRDDVIESKKYNRFRGLNLIKDGMGKMGIPKGYEYSGKGGDIGIYPVTPYTYYIQGKQREVFVNNLMYNELGFGFLHLKFLKPHFGLHNLVGDNYQKWYESKINKGEYEYNIRSFLGESNDINLDKYIKNVA